MSEVDKLTRKIYTNSRMELEFFMFLPSILTGKNPTTATVTWNPILNLRYKPNRNLIEEFDFVKATYKITPRNIYSVIKFFNTIMTWLYDDKFNDLFLMDEDNKLIFNADYNKLSASTPRGDFDQCIMQAIPTIVRFGEKAIEGVHIYVNSSKYCIPLTFQEVSIVYGILKDFSFTNEMLANMTAYRYASEHQRFETGRFDKNPFDS